MPLKKKQVFHTNEKRYFFQINLFRNDLFQNFSLAGMILLGTLIIFPIIDKLPMLGWDWYYYFNNHNPSLNISLPDSVYPPYTSWILSSITWLNWRTSLAILNSLTIMAVALGTWRQGGRWLAICYAIFNPPLLMLLWVGHPDGLVLIGVICNFIPLVIIKPQVACWSIFSSTKRLLQATGFMLLIIIFWPDWLFRLAGFAGGIIKHKEILLYNEATFGWGVFGLPLLFLGLILFIGAGKNPFRLMAAGCLISPYLMPYHLAILTPLIGKAENPGKQTIIWLTSWLVFIATGLRGYYKLLFILFPVTAFILSITPYEYFNNVIIFFRSIEQGFSILRQLLNKSAKNRVPNLAKQNRIE